MIERKEYLDKLISFKDEPVIKVITGIRRCGKSTILELFKDYLKSNGVTEDQIISVNFEDMDFSDLLDYKVLHDYVMSKTDKEKRYYLFLDELQRVDNFEIALNSLQLRKNIDIYVTGSNAFFLSGELATYLSGRYIEMSMLPLSFKEYVNFLGDKTELLKKYNNYIRYSSFPQVAYFNNDSGKIRDYLEGIYISVILKDVMGRKKINDQTALENLVSFVFDNIGNLTSINKIANTMRNDGKTISFETVESYLSAIKDAYIIYQAKRYNIKGREFLKTGGKYYVCDIGLRYYLLGTKNPDTGRILENIIYLELLRRGFKVYVGKVGDKEIDFVAQKGDTIEYYQVAETVRGEETFNREISAFKNIDDNYPKFLITMDQDLPANINGIRKINALDFLMGDY